jgi:hypothetical protein
MSTAPPESGPSGYTDEYPEYPLNYEMPTVKPVEFTKRPRRKFNSVEIGVIATAIAIAIVTLGLLISIAKR